MGREKVGAVTSRRQPDLTGNPKAGAAFSVRDGRLPRCQGPAGFALAINRCRPVPSLSPPPLKPAPKPVALSVCTLPVKAVPNAPRSEVCGWLGDALKIKVHAPPVEGRANEVLCEFLADTLGLPRRAVAVQQGGTSRHKLVRIEGLGLEDVKARLGV